MAREKSVAEERWNGLDFAQRRLVLDGLCGIDQFKGPKGKCQIQCEKYAKPVSRLKFNSLSDGIQKDLKGFFKNG